MLQELAADTVAGTWVLGGNAGPRLPWDFPTWVRGVKRGIVRKFTDASRRRFVYRLSNWRGADRFLTLTTRANERHALRSSRALGRFLNWARGRGMGSYVWVRERQRRGAIHYHVWTAGLLAPAEEIREEWLRATGEDHDFAARRHAVRVVDWKGPAWYAVAEGAKRVQKQPADPNKWGTAGRFWSCSHSVSRSHVTVPLGIDGLRWFRRWLRKVSREFRFQVRRKVFHGRRESGMKAGTWNRDTRRKAWIFACQIARRSAEWLRNFGTVGFGRHGPRCAGGYLMLDRLPDVELRLPDALARILDGPRLVRGGPPVGSSRGLVIQFAT